VTWTATHGQCQSGRKLTLSPRQRTWRLESDHRYGSIGVGGADRRAPPLSRCAALFKDDGSNNSYDDDDDDDENGEMTDSLLDSPSSLWDSATDAQDPTDRRRSPRGLRNSALAAAEEESQKNIREPAGARLTRAVPCDLDSEAKVRARDLN
jgi:hypothetical protein